MANRLEVSHAGATREGEVFASTEDGRVFYFTRVFDRFDAEAFAGRVNDKGSIDPDLWVFHRNVYGSAAYEADGDEARLAYAERYEGFGEGDDLSHVY